MGLTMSEFFFFFSGIWLKNLQALVSLWAFTLGWTRGIHGLANRSDSQASCTADLAYFSTFANFANFATTKKQIVHQ
jgi:hypothetical protein